MSMNVSASDLKLPAARPLAPSQPLPETKSRFDEALQRREKGAAKNEDLGSQASSETQGPMLQSGFQQLRGFDFDQERDEKQPPAQAIDDLTPTAHAHVAPSAIDSGHATATSVTTAAALPAGYAEMAARMDLPTATAVGTTQLTMSDQRWIASQATITRSDNGALEVDVQSRSGEDSDQALESLRLRLNARGHKLAVVRSAGSV